MRKIWIVVGCRLMLRLLPPPSHQSSVSSTNTTESPTNPATSGTAGYIIAAIIVSQVITAREHPPRLLLRQEGVGRRVQE